MDRGVHPEAHSGIRGRGWEVNEGPVLASANRRTIARWLDTLIFGFAGSFVISFFWILFFGPIPQEVSGNQLLNAFLGFLSTAVLAPPCIKKWGRTPGKALLGIRVVSVDGTPITWARAWKREFLVWTTGLWLGIPLLFLFAAALAMRRVVSTGRAKWDEATQTDVIRS